MILGMVVWYSGKGREDRYEYVYMYDFIYVYI